MDQSDIGGSRKKLGLLNQTIKSKFSQLSTKFASNKQPVFPIHGNWNSVEDEDGVDMIRVERSETSSSDILDLDLEAFREANIEGDDGGVLAQYVNSSLIYEAGVDREGQLMLVFAACQLPDPKSTDYDRLLNLIMFRLDDFVENDYTLIFFAAGSQYKPSIKWVYRAYKRLTRKYKKNLKNLYIVHPALWIKITMEAMSSILSPKFNRKLVWISKLSDLAKEVPLEQINIPDAVYAHNLTKEQQIEYEADFSMPGKYFGVELEALMGQNGERGVPPVVTDAVDYLFSHGLTTPDIFRKMPPKDVVRKVRAEYEQLDKTSVAYALHGEYVAAAVLKAWIGELPHPLVPLQLYKMVRAIPIDQGEVEAATYIRDILLPSMCESKCTAILLSILIRLLDMVSQNSGVNNMTAVRLAVAWAPCWVRSTSPELDVEMCSATRIRLPDLESPDANVPKPSNVVTLIRIMISYYDFVFAPTILEFKDTLAIHRITSSVEDPPPKPPRRKPTDP
ncbi:Rho GTPase-activating protein 1 [Zancudomyces culisetae]|uniref:Rho GTPase-activating protein 1 n=1 Tax=Zancudomyces culisetae TaxID=1213189 RepID=A0A1R1PH92_ZANCU|nr:Rho GTPase-activating protein 1 [Zancudomyces culisetae]|eukprot:OMH80307.1 Rho GTPase-activating protein 1 [Zancudomyces culisetae]